MTQSAHASRAPAAPPRAVVISSSLGAGHDGVARELAARLVDRGFAVERHDILELLPWRLGAFSRRFYEWQLRRAPASYQALYDATDRLSIFAWGHRRYANLAVRRLRAILDDGVSVVVSTNPDGAQAVATLRRRGELRAAAITYLTDFAVDRTWVAPGTDLYLAVHEVAASAAADRGARPVLVAGPAVRRDFTRVGTPVERAAVREAFGLSPDARIALLVGGSWGVGDIAGTAALIAESGAAVPVVVCGRNHGLRRSLTRTLGDRGVALGWVDDMAGLMRASDVLVENAGGLTALEALAARLPVINFATIPGHGIANAIAMQEAGVLRRVHEPAQLPEILSSAVTQRLPESSVVRHDAAALISAAARRAGSLPPRAFPRWHRRAVVAAACLAAAFGTGVVEVPAAVANPVPTVAHAPDGAYLVVRLGSHTNVSAQLVNELRTAAAAIVADKSVVHDDFTADQLASAGLDVVEPTAGAHSRLEQRRSLRAFVAGHHVPLYRAGLAHLNRQRAIVPTVWLPRDELPSALPPGAIILLDARQLTDAQLLAQLTAITRSETQAHLHALPIRSLIGSK